MPEDEMEEIEGCTAIRKFVCACLCEWYMPVGIEPSFCPHCGGECAEVKIMPADGALGIGYYQEGEQS